MLIQNTVFNDDIILEILYKLSGDDLYKMIMSSKKIYNIYKKYQLIICKKNLENLLTIKINNTDNNNIPKICYKLNNQNLINSLIKSKWKQLTAMELYLYYISDYCHLDVVKFLLDYGTNKDKVFSFSLENCNFKVACILLKYGANINYLPMYLRYTRLLRNNSIQELSDHILNIKNYSLNEIINLGDLLKQRYEDKIFSLKVDKVSVCLNYLMLFMFVLNLFINNNYLNILIVSITALNLLKCYIINDNYHMINIFNIILIISCITYIILYFLI